MPLVKSLLLVALRAIISLPLKPRCDFDTGVVHNANLHWSPDKPVVDDAVDVVLCSVGVECLTRDAEHMGFL